MENKTIYMTYKKPVPDKVFSRWINLNKEYTIDFSLDTDCIYFLKTHFNDYISDLFLKIPTGMYKADLWRLCKLYINGGVYSDVDLVPYINLDTLDKDITFYSCISAANDGIFQAFMKCIGQRSPLILIFLLSFLQNNPYKICNGPTFDMYNCIKYNLNDINILPEEKYEINEVKICINIGSSDTNTKQKDLYFFPNDIEYVIKLVENYYNDAFNFVIENNILNITRIDNSGGWGHNHSVNICIKSNERILLFKELFGQGAGHYNHITQACVTFHGNKILDSRDPDYYDNKGW